MKILSSTLLLTVLLTFMFACKKNSSFPVISFVENFDKSTLWTLSADSISTGGTTLRAVSKIENGSLVLDANQNGRCVAARALHPFDVQKILGTEGKLMFQLNISEMSTSSSGNIDLRINYKGTEYLTTVKGNISSPQGVNFIFNGSSIEPEDKDANQGISFYTKASSPSQNPEGISITADACGFDNFAYAKVKIDSFVLLEYQR